MRTKKNLSDKTLALLTATALGVVVSLSATATYAGFQWVPPTGQDPAAAPATTNEVPPAEPVATENVEQMVLPMPGDQAAAQPAAQQPIAQPAPQPVAVKASPQLKPQDIAAPAVQQPAPQTVIHATLPPPTNEPSPARQSLQLPPDYQSQTVAAPQENVLHVKNISARPENAPGATNAAAADPISWQEPQQPQAAQQPALLQPVPVPVQVEPAPAPVTTTKVIMPQDAPQTAVNNTPNSQKLTISPYPGAANPNAPQQQAAAPVEQQAAPVNYAAVEGFGSDMPLALALQQIVPAEYAYSFGSNVNPGQTVSWDGGKPWNQIVSDMLAPHKLQAVIVGKVVHIRQEGLQQQGALETPGNDNLAEVKRANINDPGEQQKLQAANLAGIESAAGEEAPAAVTAQIAVPPASEEVAALSMPPASAEAVPKSTVAKIEVPETTNESTTLSEASPTVPITELNVEPKAQANVAEIAPSDAAPAPAPAATEVKPAVWQAKAGESLKEILTRWSEKAGVELVWMASYDFKLKQDVVIDDTFSTAVETVVNNGIDAQITPALQVLQTGNAGKTQSIVIKDKAV